MRGGHLQARKRALTGNQTLLDLHPSLPASRTGRDKSLCLSHPVYRIVLWQSKQTHRTGPTTVIRSTTSVVLRLTNPGVDYPFMKLVWMGKQSEKGSGEQSGRDSSTFLGQGRGYRGRD